jgi:diguanylate cyclase (GGDEF)-like protein
VTPSGSNPRPMPVALRLLIAAVLVGGLSASVAGMAVAGRAPNSWAFLAGVGLFAAAQAVRINVPFRGSRLHVGWGETALIIVLCLMSPGWVVPVAAVGVLLGQLASGIAPIKGLYNAGSVALGTVLAGAAVHALGGRPAVPVDGHGHGLLVLLVAAALYLVVTTCLVSAAVTLADRVTPAGVARGVGTRWLLPFGGVALGLLAVLLRVPEFHYLALVPPVLWLLYAVYRDRRRVGRERRSWQAFAAATHDLNRLDAPAVIESAVGSALRLFAPEAVEIALLHTGLPSQVHVGRPDGQAIRITGRGEDLPRRGEHLPRRDGEPWAGGTEPTADEYTRVLTVDGERIGWLRLLFGSSGELGEREQLRLSAFADALGAALHNATAHGRLREMADRKAYEAGHDPLTGLANRASLLATGDERLRAGYADGGQVSLLLLDLDHFKDVNDTIGHAAGDELLRAVAGRLTAAAGDGETLARLGGDEFALLIAEPPEGRPAIEHAADRARELSAALSTPIEIAGVALSIEASIGVVAAPDSGCAMAELLRRADVAMYQAKKGGRPIARYAAERDAGSTDRLALLAELREALATDDQLVLELQPAVDLATGGPVGVEALIRWRHPRRGRLGPGEFVSAVEQSDLIRPFTSYVLNAALSVMADWAVEGLDVPVAVNLSVRNLLDRRLPGEVADLLRLYRIPPEQLILEITETVMMTELDIIDDVLAGLRAIGVQLAVDDFGTGYSSLTFLARFAVDEVKVDQAFVAQMADSPEAEAIVRSTVELGRALGLRVIAEGVETDEQRAALAAMGCSAGQGYHFYPPMEISQATRALWDLRESTTAEVITLPHRATNEA